MGELGARHLGAARAVAAGLLAVAAAMWVHVVAGIVVAVLAAVNIWFGHNRPLSAA